MKLSRTIGRKKKNTGTISGKQKRRPNLKPSEKQREQRAKFAIAVAFTRTLANLLSETLYDPIKDKPGFSKAISLVIKRAIVGTYPHYDISYSEVVISQGDLPNALQATASSDTPGTIRFDWTNRDVLTGIARSTDKVLMAAYCPEYKRSVYRIGTVRSALRDTLSTQGFKNKIVYTWLAFISEDGTEVSDSLFTGELTVAG